MKARLENLPRSLQASRRSLLEAYDVEELHRLRVGLRRMRSYLKSRRGSKALHLRHELGKLADTTNDARDWDTLVARTNAYRKQGQLRLLEDELHRRQIAAQQPAMEMLQSARWGDTMRQWDLYMRRHPVGSTTPSGLEKTLQKSHNRVMHAWQRARHTGSSRNWHKLRIAVKELRYRLEAQPGEAKNTESSRLLKHCKTLQGLLGDWHDTVVHVQLLRELAESYDPESDTEVLKTLLDWRRDLEAEGRQCLDATNANFASGKMERHVNF